MKEMVVWLNAMDYSDSDKVWFRWGLGNGDGNLDSDLPILVSHLILGTFLSAV